MGTAQRSSQIYFYQILTVRFNPNPFSGNHITLYRFNYQGSIIIILCLIEIAKCFVHHASIEDTLMIVGVSRNPGLITSSFSSDYTQAKEKSSPVATMPPICWLLPS